MPATSPSSYATDARTVTPDDGADIDPGCIGLSCAASGAVQVTTERGTTLPITVVAGGIFPQGVSRVWSTGTSATGIVAHYRT